jgi:spermidine/putrescine transport system permease protein
MMNIKKINALKNKIYILPLFIWQVVFFCFPMMTLFYAYFPYKNFFDIIKWLNENNYIRIIFSTFYISFITGIACILLSLLLAHCILQQSEKRQKILLFLFFIPSVSHFLLHILAIINFFYNSHLLHFFGLSLDHFVYSSFSVYTGYIYCYLPFSFLPLYISLKKINRYLFLAATDLGSNFFQYIFKILLPLLRNSLISTFSFIFIASSSEFTITQTLGGGRQFLISSAISETLMNQHLTEHSIVMITLFILTLGIATKVLSFIFNISITYLAKM